MDRARLYAIFMPPGGPNTRLKNQYSTLCFEKGIGNELISIAETLILSGRTNQRLTGSTIQPGST